MGAVESTAGKQNIFEGGRINWKNAVRSEAKMMKSYIFLYGALTFIFYRFMTNHKEVLEIHFPMPDPSKWTNKELGIPPDDAD